MPPSSKNTVDLDRLEQHFAARCRAVTRIPYDPHLAEGAEVELDQLSRAAADAYLGLAAIVGDGLAWPRNAAHPGMAQPSAARWRTAAGTPRCRTPDRMTQAAGLVLAVR